MLHAAPEPINTLWCAMVTPMVHLPLAYLTQDSWIPDPRMLVRTRNAHKYALVTDICLQADPDRCTELYEALHNAADTSS